MDHAPVFDITMLEELSRLDGDGATMRRLIGMFCEMIPDQLELVDAAFAAKDESALTNATHKMKGSARVVGAVALGHACEALERAGTKRSDLLRAVHVESRRALGEAKRIAEVT